MANYFIVMGDILKSREYDGNELMQEFKDLVSSCNRDLSDGILSPYTITLGDEFQGVTKSLNWAVQSLLYFENSALKRELPFKLRYVVHYGKIDTPLNNRIAYEMVGYGLTHARQLLGDKRRGKPRFFFDLPNMNLAIWLNRLFGVMTSLRRRWRKKDYGLISEMLVSKDNDAIGNKYGKNRSQIWKRRRYLNINDYEALKETVLDLSKGNGTE